MYHLGLSGSGAASMGYPVDPASMPPGFMPVPIYNMQGKANNAMLVKCFF